MRGLSLLVVFGLCTVALPGTGAEVEAAPTVYFRDDFESGAEGWWGDPGWGVTDNRARSGTHAMYFGDDKGTADPADNDVLFCDQTFCTHELRTPVVGLPDGAPVHLYFWTQEDLLPAPFDDVFSVDVEVMGPDDQVLERERVLGSESGHGWWFHADLSSNAGDDIRLVFAVRPAFLHEWEEGLYLDDVILTDVLFPLETVHSWTGAGSAASMSFTAASDAPVVATLRIEGTLSPGRFGYILSRTHEGQHGVSSSTSAGMRGFAVGTNVTHHQVVYHLPAGVTATLLGMRIFDHDATLTTLSDGQAWLTLTLEPHRMQAGQWALTFSAFGFENATSTVTFRLQADGMAAGAVGGKEVVYDTPHGLDATLLVAEHHEGTYALVEGRGSWQTEGPSLGWLALLVPDEDYTTQTPEGADPRHVPAHAQVSGKWSIDVPFAFGTDADAYTLMVAEVPAAPTQATLDGPDLSLLPIGPRTGDVHLPSKGERVWELGGSFGCQARIMGAGTDSSCGLFPLIWSGDWFPILSRAGLTAIEYRIDGGMSWIGPAPETTVGDVCIDLQAVALAGRDCGPYGEMRTLMAGTPLFDAPTRLEFTVEKETGAALLERLDLHLVLHYDLR